MPDRHEHSGRQGVRARHDLRPVGRRRHVVGRRAEGPAVAGPLTIPEGDGHRLDGVTATGQQAARRGHLVRGHCRPARDQPRVVRVGLRSLTERAQEAGELFLAEPMIGDQVRSCRRRGRARAGHVPRLVPAMRGHHAVTGAWQCLHARGIWRLRIAQRSFDRACAVVTGAAPAAGSATGLGGPESTMNLSPRSHARALARGPGAGVGVSSIVTTFR